jgi:hypothetical protein
VVLYASEHSYLRKHYKVVSQRMTYFEHVVFGILLNLTLLPLTYSLFCLGSVRMLTEVQRQHNLTNLGVPP